MVTDEEQVVAEARYWHPLLQSWLLADNREDARAGWRAMDRFMEVVGSSLASSTTQQTPRELVAREGAALYTEFARLLTPPTRELLGGVIQAVSRAQWGEVAHPHFIWF